MLKLNGAEKRVEAGSVSFLPPPSLTAVAAALVVLVGFVALAGCGDDEATGDSAESDGEISVPEECDRGTVEYPVEARALLDEGTRVRVVFIGDPPVPCAVRIEAQADQIKLTVLVPNVDVPLVPRVYCAEATLPEAGLDTRIVPARAPAGDPGVEIVGKAAIKSALTSGQDCPTVNVETG